MTLLSQITFFEVAMSLMAVGAIDELMRRYAPETLVGPNGWLIETNDADD